MKVRRDMVVWSSMVMVMVMVRYWDMWDRGEAKTGVEACQKHTVSYFRREP